ncbi:hypothetical protein Vadar_018994 [Vaccinium darrowii]|uniref:Uncharacterized protein n=1 Tax=Vaccinium darrowii TaxID=229202 RepID=A0ACB7X2G9_9ERIC|nr:hypothetical protein Vadar_018994 [Vaccinium darrowii]
MADDREARAPDLRSNPIQLNAPQIRQQRKDCAQLREREIKALRSNLTFEQILAKQANLRKEVERMEKKLAKMRGGVSLVSPEERKAVDGRYTDTINQWRRREKMFKDVWDAITENSPKNLKDFKEEFGIEYDEDVGVSLHPALWLRRGKICALEFKGRQAQNKFTCKEIENLK